MRCILFFLVALLFLTGCTSINQRQNITLSTEPIFTNTPGSVPEPSAFPDIADTDIPSPLVVAPTLREFLINPEIEGLCFGNRIAFASLLPDSLAGVGVPDISSVIFERLNDNDANWRYDSLQIIWGTDYLNQIKLSLEFCAETKSRQTVFRDSSEMPGYPGLYRRKITMGGWTYIVLLGEYTSCYFSVGPNCTYDIDMLYEYLVEISLLFAE